jgi:hypothetical protein
LRLADRRVAVEITSYVRGRSPRGSPLREQHSWLHSILGQASRRYTAKNPDEPLWVTIDPEPGTAAVGTEELARLLCEAIESSLQSGGIPARPTIFGLTVNQLGDATMLGRLRDPATQVFYECAVADPLAPIMSRITVVRLARGSAPRWGIRQSGDTRAYTTELEDLIASKESKIPTYLRHGDEVWLVIDAFGGDILQAITMTPTLLQHPFRTAFTRVFLVDTTETTHYQMQTLAPDERRT